MTYEDGHNLAVQDIKRFGMLHAMDKMHLFDGDFQRGYKEGIDSFRHIPY